MLSLMKKKERPVFFDAESWRIAAIDIYLAAHVAPRVWPLEKRQKVIREIRAGKEAAAVAQDQLVDVGPVDKLRRLIRSVSSVSQIIRAQSGVVAIEFAIVAPVLILLVMGCLNYGLAGFTYQRLQFGVEGAARCGGLGQCKDPTSIAAYATSAAKLPGATYVVTTDTCGVLVAATYQFDLIQLFPTTMLSVTACYPKEQGT